MSFFLSLPSTQHSNIPTPQEVIIYFLNSLLDCRQNDQTFSQPQSSGHSLTHGVTSSKIFIVKMDLEKSKMNSLPNYIRGNLNKTNHRGILEVALSQKEKKREKGQLHFLLVKFLTFL